jgi:hypothetical protein
MAIYHKRDEKKNLQNGLQESGYVIAGLLVLKATEIREAVQLILQMLFVVKRVFSDVVLKDCLNGVKA